MDVATAHTHTHLWTGADVAALRPRYPTPLSVAAERAAPQAVCVLDDNPCPGWK